MFKNLVISIIAVLAVCSPVLAQLPEPMYTLYHIRECTTGEIGLTTDSQYGECFDPLDGHLWENHPNNPRYTQIIARPAPDIEPWQVNIDTLKWLRRENRIFYTLGGCYYCNPPGYVNQIKQPDDYLRFVESLK